MGAAVIEEPVRLLISRDEAATFLHAQLERGRQVKAARIKSREQLDNARAAKLQWVQRATAILRQVFSDSSMADQFNDWSVEILPEYAGLEMFVEIFYAEMNQRLSRMKQIIKNLQTFPEGVVMVAQNENIEAVEAPPSRSRHEKAPKGEGAAANAGFAMPGEFAGNARGAAGAASAKTLSFDADPMAARRVLLMARGEEAHCSAVHDMLKKLGLEVVVDAQESSADESPDVDFGILVAKEAHDDKADHSRFIFNLGMLTGRLGAANFVIVSPPRNLSVLQELGLHTLQLDPLGAWHLALARQMRRAGLAVDLNRLC